MERILNYWSKSEYFTPFILPERIPSGCERYKIVHREDVPWIKDDLHNMRRLLDFSLYGFTVYFGVFDLTASVEKIEKYFGEPLLLPETIKSNSCICKFELIKNEKGKIEYIDTSLSVSTFAFATGKIMSGSFEPDDWVDGFKSLNEKINTLFKNSENITDTWDFFVLDILKNRVKEYLGWDVPFLAAFATVDMKELEKSDENENIDPLLNSFYIKELDRLTEESKKGNVGNGLKKYINGCKEEKRVELNGNTEAIDKILSPFKLTSGKWPVKYKAGMMQQVALNLVFDEEMEKSGIFSVNGPPGTGKTTLLRDLIAEISVKRAVELCRFDDPKSALKPPKALKCENDDSTYQFYEMAESLKNFGVVVMSTNNGAVENISKELPPVTAVDSEIAGDFDYFGQVASNIFDSPCWALISAALGNTKNCAAFFEKFWLDEDKLSMRGALNREKPFDSWHIARDRFLAKYTGFLEVKLKLQKYYNAQKEKNNIEEFLTGEGKNLEIGGVRLQKIFMDELSDTDKLIHEARIALGDCFGDGSYFKDIENSLFAQSNTPWTNDWVDRLRSNLFIESLRLQKEFVLHLKQEFISNLDVFYNLLNNNFNNEIKTEYTAAVYDSFFMVVPAISTTFASCGRLFKNVGREQIGWLLIDEAGQGIPQAAAGAIWRARRTVVVGDPMQIQPVVTVPDAIRKRLARYYGVDASFSEKNISIQSLADRANKYGSFRKGQEIWVGCPLKVHRRCGYPMFDIANKIAYDESMINAIKETDPKKSFGCFWADIKGKALYPHYIDEQAEYACEIAADEFAKISGSYPTLFIITPFVTVKEGIINKFLSRNYLYEKITQKLSENGEINLLQPHMVKRWCYSSIGTVHTFQGKETDNVIFCLGGDMENKGKGAAGWAASGPNILNVAVTRAKHGLIIIGDINLWKNLKYFSVAYDILNEIN